MGKKKNEGGKKQQRDFKMPKMLAAYRSGNDQKKERKKIERKPSAMKPKTAHVEHGDKRAIDYTIHKNKGLTVHRKKEDRNPRVKLRKKYAKAQKRRRGQVREVYAEKQYASNAYGGEITGINRSVVRSVKLS